MDETHRAATDDAIREEVADLTSELVAIPSHEDERAAGEAICEWLTTETDAAVTIDAHGNVIARKTPDRASDAELSGAAVTQPTDRSSLAFVGHHDVVPPADGQVTADGDRFVVERREGRLHGRGTADMKGAVAAAMLAFRDVDREQLAEAGVDLLFVSYVGEEQGGTGCRAAIADGFVPDYAVVGEGSTGYSAPGVTDVAIAHKGRRGSTITATGESAHASEPEAGVNAVYRACAAVEIVRSLDAPESTVADTQVTGSVAVTEIDGGTAWNVIPEECRVTVDERTVPGDRAALERVERVEGVTLAVDQDLPPMACDEPGFADAVLAAARVAHESPDEHESNADESPDEHESNADESPDDASGTVTGASQPQHVVKPHATDAGWLADAGTTTVVAGPAEPGEAHTDSESVSLAVLERCVRLYRGVVQQAPFDAV